MKTDKPLQKTDAYPDVDTYVTMRLRLRVDVLSLTPEEIAARAGLAVEQVTAFLAGTARVPASALFSLAKALDVAVYFFFDCSQAETAS